MLEELLMESVMRRRFRAESAREHCTLYVQRDVLAYDVDVYSLGCVGWSWERTSVILFDSLFFLERRNICSMFI